MTFGDSLSTLPASIESFREIFSAKDFTYQFDSYSTIIFPISETEEKESIIRYSFSLNHIPYNTSKPTSPTSLLLPYSTLHSPGFNKIASVSASASKTPSCVQLNEKEIVNEKQTVDPTTMTSSTNIPKTFAYTLSLLDCSFNKRPFPGIWQLR